MVWIDMVSHSGWPLALRGGQRLDLSQQESQRTSRTTQLATTLRPLSEDIFFLSFDMLRWICCRLQQIPFSPVPSTDHLPAAKSLWSALLFAHQGFTSVPCKEPQHQLDCVGLLEKSVQTFALLPLPSLRPGSLLLYFISCRVWSDLRTFCGTSRYQDTVEFLV